MTREEFTEARAALPQTDDQLAAELGVTPHVVRAWSAGTAPIPRRYAQQVTWMAAVAEREAALRASGLPGCAWLRAREDAPLPKDADALLAHAEETGAHLESCPTCLARERFVAERFGPMPPFPQPGWVRVVGLAERLPPWARPAAWGAAILGAIVSLRLVFALPLLFSAPAKFLALLPALLLAAGAGAVGGLAYSLTRPTLRKLGRAGDYLTGIVCVFAYMGALAGVAPLAFGERVIEDRAELVIFSVISVVFGLVVGHSWFREPARRRRSSGGAGAG